MADDNSVFGQYKPASPDQQRQTTVGGTPTRPTAPATPATPARPTMGSTLSQPATATSPVMTQASSARPSNAGAPIGGLASVTRPTPPAPSGQTTSPHMAPRPTAPSPQPTRPTAPAAPTRPMAPPRQEAAIASPHSRQPVQPHGATAPVTQQDSSYKTTHSTAPVGGLAAVQRPMAPTRPAAPPPPPRPAAPAQPQSPTIPSHLPQSNTATAPVTRQESSYQPSHAGAPIGGLAAVTRTASSTPARPTAAPASRGQAPVGGLGAVGTNVPSLTREDFLKYSDLIYKISGIRFAENKSYFLASKLKARMEENKINTLDEYYKFLQSPMSSSKEHPALVDEITINETFFFRNQPQLEAFEANILKPMIEKRRQQGGRVRIWSCASSTGDEAYTTTLQLLSMPEANGMQFEIIGTDICRQAVASAQQGVYRKYAIRNIPPDMLRKYFIENTAEATWTLKQEVRSMVKFQECNLMDAQKIRMLGRFDIAFCRNVLIYFDDQSKERALWNIHNALADDGFLLAGHSENLYPQRHIFKQVTEHGQAMAYQKQMGEGGHAGGLPPLPGTRL